MKQFPISSGTIHFVGIGGIGMSGIADILVNLGYRVSGSDLKTNVMTDRLARKGCSIKLGHVAENVREASVVVLSSAISQDNPEVLEARRLKIPIVKRAEMLAELMKMKMSVAVAGTHGKTTTTSLIAAMLDQADFDPTVINGGIINAYNSNARLGSGDWIVVEADESDGSFSRLMSTIAVITNIDFDHVDNFNDFSELRDLFVKFVENIPFYGTGVLCIDHPEVAKIASKMLDRKILTYSLKSQADVSCSNVHLDEQGARFDVKFSDNVIQKYGVSDSWKGFASNMYGDHNVQNMLAAICVGLELRISEENMKAAFSSFMGVKRRFTKVADVNGVTVIDDYAHHPVEISSVLTAARHSCKGRIFAVIQPHRYTRLKNFLSDFADCLELSNGVFITPIYSANEKSNGVDHFSLLKKLNENGVVKGDFVQDIETLKDKIFPQLSKGDFVIFLGAGDITNWAYNFAELLRE
ncbi:MAG: UDP-N-acetylmuramate--L-alanine ligase [Alphaproteobacteria bacterium]|nr:UDP-N-acetylmuramate--L-alanine ligase [Alphaproteobacteria bacterium]